MIRKVHSLLHSLLLSLPLLAGGSAVLAQEFPVTLAHEYGETVIAEKPVRIATIGWMTQAWCWRWARCRWACRCRNGAGTRTASCPG